MHDSPYLHKAPKGRDPVSIEDLRSDMRIKLSIYHKAFLSQRRTKYANPKDVVEALTKGWDEYEITRPASDDRPPFEAWMDKVDVGKAGG